MEWPLENYIITRDFYYLSSLYVGGQHAALDLIRKTGVTSAALVYAVATGIVIGVGWDPYSGFFVALQHADGWQSFYRHLHGQAPVVVNQLVGQGQAIGEVGSTGVSEGPHLHFDLWSETPIEGAFEKNGIWAVDPELYLGIEVDEEDDDMATLRYIKATGATHGWVTDGIGKIGIGGPFMEQVLRDYRNLGLLKEVRPGVPFPVAHEFIAVLIDVHKLT